VNRLPIIYIRGYAGSTSGIDTQVDDPFYGFNKGATHVRVGGAGEPRFYQFEGPMLRLMIDHDYQLLVHGDQRAFLESAKPGTVAADSIWVYRFYDQAATTFVQQPHRGILSRLVTGVQNHVSANGFDIESAAAGLLDLIDLVTTKIEGDDKRVILVAHSMGGLIARCMMQKIAVKRGRSTKDLVAKLFTYGTPHGGIVFQNAALNWFEDVIGSAGSDIFAPQNMYGYLEPDKNYGDQPRDGAQWDPQAIPEDVFDVDNVFCLIGTDSKDYGVSKTVVGPKSDGLVRIEHAYVRKAHRAFVFKSHSGSYGEVNSEEGYQNLRRFLFGRWKVRVDLVGLPAGLTAAAGNGTTSWQADMRLAVRGLPVVLSEQRADQFCPVQLNDELARQSDTPDHPVPLLTTFLLDPHAAGGRTATVEEETSDKHGGIARYSMTLRVAQVKEHDRFFDFSDHLEQVFDWADAAIFDVGPDQAGTGLVAWANWNTQIPGALDDFDPTTTAARQQISRLSGGQWQFELPLPDAGRSLHCLGPDAKLRITITDRTASSA
jgi:pimeloyl-ACP methyl ester carboxylesterase